MLYRPDIGFHGTIESQIGENELCNEPALTLCDPVRFGYWGGNIAHRVFEEISKTSAFSRIAILAKNNSDATIRFTTHTLWLEDSQVPSARRDWHLDRVGPLLFKGNTELADLRDPFGFPSYILVSVFFPFANGSRSVRDCVSTEFVLDTFEGSSGDYLVDPRIMTKDIDNVFRTNPFLRTMKVGDRMIVSFSPRSAHRPGKAVVSGWRFFLRIGLYTHGEECSPYPNHYVFYNPSLDLKKNSVVFRKIGQKESISDCTRRSISLINFPDEALEFSEKHSLSIGKDEGIQRIDSIIMRSCS